MIAEVVYRCKDDAERSRRVSRAEALVGVSFVKMPGNMASHAVLFISSEGVKVRVSDIEMVANDALLMDAISNWGEDGPLYRDTLEGQVTQREVYDAARHWYREVALPIPLVNPHGATLP